MLLDFLFFNKFQMPCFWQGKASINFCKDKTNAPVENSSSILGIEIAWIPKQIYY